MLAETDKTLWCRDVEACEQLTVVFFYAPWCRNCKAVRPRIERLEHEFGQARFLQCNFKKEAALCYEERVFTFPTVHFYLPRIGRVSRAVLTAKDTAPKMRELLNRFLGGTRQIKLLQSLRASALRPVVQYQELVSALEGLAALGPSAAGDDATELDAPAFGSGLSPKKESARLRGLVEGDELRLAQLEGLFAALDADADGRLRLDDLAAAVAATRPERGAASDEVLQRLREATGLEGAEVGIDKRTFVSLMIDKAVADFAAGEKALLPAFEALDGDGDGTITQAQLLTTIERFCAAVPAAEGCDVDHRPLRLAQAFDAFADAEQLLDYTRFVEMVSGRKEPADECEVGEREHVASSSYLADELELGGERECFGEAVDDEGEDDPGCDAWFFGEDPTVKKVVHSADPAKVAALRAAGEAAIARRRQMEEVQARLKAALPLKIEPSEAPREG